MVAVGGRGVYLIREEKERLYLNEVEITKRELFDELKNSDDYMITEYVDQHDYSKKIFDKSVNTIRVVTTINTENGRATVLRAVHRIGKNSTIPVDNADKGALISKINIDTGIMGKAKTFYSTDLFCMHPDTGEQIEGIKIPHWDEVKRKVTNVAEKFPYIYFIAWDIVVTEESFMVIEINASSGLNIFQMWQGERNTELGNFYRKHNIIK